MIFIFKGLVSPFLTIVKTIFVFGFPLIKETASSIVILRVDLSFIFRIISPAFIPALYAGVSSIGDMTVSTPFLIPTVIPRPPNSPLVCICISLKAFLSRKEE